MLVLLVLAVLCTISHADLASPLGSLEFRQVSPKTERFHVKASPSGPGSRELPAAAGSGDAMFIFGGQGELERKKEKG